jgi:hypothetical protein
MVLPARHWLSLKRLWQDAQQRQAQSPAKGVSGKQRKPAPATPSNAAAALITEAPRQPAAASARPSTAAEAVDVVTLDQDMDDVRITLDHQDTCAVQAASPVKKGGGKAAAGQGVHANGGDATGGGAGDGGGVSDPEPPSSPDEVHILEEPGTPGTPGVVVVQGGRTAAAGAADDITPVNNGHTAAAAEVLVMQCVDLPAATTQASVCSIIAYTSASWLT